MRLCSILTLPRMGLSQRANNRRRTQKARNWNPGLSGESALIRLQATSYWLMAAFLLHPHLGFDGQARPELVVRVFFGQVGEVDADGEALHDLDVVAGGVFRREEREHGAGGAADLRDPAAIVLAGGVDVDLDRSGRPACGASCVSLKFAVIQRSSSETRVSRFWPDGDVLVDLDALAGDDAVVGSDDLCSSSG